MAAQSAMPAVMPAVMPTEQLSMGSQKDFRAVQKTQCELGAALMTTQTRASRPKTAGERLEAIATALDALLVKGEGRITTYYRRTDELVELAVRGCRGTVSHRLGGPAARRLRTA